MGDNGFVGTLLAGAAIVGTGGAALGALAPTLAGGAAATATAAAVPGFFAANAGIFSAVSGIASAGMNLMQGATAKRAADFERQQIIEQGKREKTQYAIEAADREMRLNDILSTQSAAFGSRGIMLGTGVSETARRTSIGEANRGTSVAEFNRNLNQRQIVSMASQKKLEGQNAFYSGVGNATTSLISLARSGVMGTGAGA